VVPNSAGMPRVSFCPRRRASTGGLLGKTLERYASRFSQHQG
jgi:hypothetical protein